MHADGLPVATATPAAFRAMLDAGRKPSMRARRPFPDHAQGPSMTRTIRIAARCRALAAAAALAFIAPATQADTTGLPTAPGPATGLADSAALRATVFGTAPDDLAEQPERVPVREIDIRMPWARPVPPVLWFNSHLRVWFSQQPREAPLAVVIAGTGADGNASNMKLLRGALYGGGYHVLTVPSPTFPGFITSTSSTGVAGDLRQDGADLYRAVERIIANLPDAPKIGHVDVLGYSLGGANAAMLKAIDARERRLGVRRVVMINPPVSLFNSIGRLDRLFAQAIGPADAGLERLYQQLYAELANLYRVSNAVAIDESFLYGAAASVLRSDAEFSAAIALNFRLALANMFFAGDLYAATGAVVDPNDPPRPGDSLEQTYRVLRGKPFADYFDQVFAPYYLAHRAGSTRASLVADNRLDTIGDLLRDDAEVFVQTSRDDLILDRDELAWLETTFGPRIIVYDHGGHLGTIGSRQQVADMLAMLGGRWPGGAR